MYDITMYNITMYDITMYDITMYNITMYDITYNNITIITMYHRRLRTLTRRTMSFCTDHFSFLTFAGKMK